MREKRIISTNQLYWKPEKQYPYILENIESIFERGYIYGIIGPNGSGKTSLIRNLLRLVEPSSGNVEVDGENIQDIKRKNLARKMAMVPQHTGMDSQFSAYDIVMMGRAPYQKRFADAGINDKEVVNKAMQITDCYYFKDKEVSLLSGGEVQRVATARAIAQDTDWLILDEPTASLDVRHQVALMESLVGLKENQDKSVIIILHDINIASEYCDRIVMMKDGTIYSQGDTKEVITCENLEETYGIAFHLITEPDTGKRYFMPEGKRGGEL